LDYGGNRHGFLAFSEIHPDYYQIPKEDKVKLIEESKLEAKQQQDEVDLAEESIDKGHTKPKSRVRKRNKQIKKSANEDVREIPQDIISEEINENKIADDKASIGKSKEELNHENGEPEITELINEEAEIEIRRAAAKRGKSLIRKYNIQEVIKVRQIMLVQVVKEERGNKGAALTSYLSLAGRYCVLMPNTTRGGGISRKITNPNDRKRLKEITNGITVPESAGLIIRTAGVNRTKVEIKKDYEYLIRQWGNLRDLTLKSIAPQ
jgi:Ribonucleases G and E